MIRGGIYGLLALIALAFCLAAIGTTVAEWAEASPQTGGQDLSRKLTAWYYCQRAGATSPMNCAPMNEHPCQGFKDRVRAAEAFYVMTAIVLLAAILFAVLDHGNVHGFRHYSTVLLLLAVAIIVFSLIGWAVMISAVRESFCEGDGVAAQAEIEEQPNFDWGASPFLLLITTIIGIVMLIVAHRAPGASTEHLRPTHHEDPHAADHNGPMRGDAV
jgi:hypothetical protein